MATIKCVCPLTPAGKTRHPDGDTVTLKEGLDFRASVGIRNTVLQLKFNDPKVSEGELMAALTEGYLLNGIASWTLVDAKGKPAEPTRAAIREFMEDHLDEAIEVGNEADALYMESVMLPLILRGSASSQDTPMESSTSPTNGSRLDNPKPSKPSSTSTSQTDDTEQTSDSPDGDSNSSPRLKSVG